MYPSVSMFSSLTVLFLLNVRSATTQPVTPGAKWDTCPTEISPLLLCTDISVPLDYEDPTGEQISLKLVKLRIKEGGDKKGSVVWQLGGPGEITTELLNYTVNGVSDVFGELRNHFDIVTAEPRGIAFNHAIKCDPKFNQQKLPYFPRSEADYNETLKFFGDMGKDCAERTGKIINHLDTRTQARDLEAVRLAIGSEKLNYYGLSWGTLRGSQYAQLYPDNIRAMILDGVVDHSISATQFAASESLGYDVAQRRMLEWMGSNSSSALDGRDAVKIHKDLVKKADETPLLVPGCAESGQCFANVTGNDIRILTVASVNSPLLWPKFSRTIQEAYDDDNATALAFPIVATEAGVTQSMLGVICQDWQFAQNWDEYRSLQFMNTAFSEGPQGAIGARMWSSACAAWPTSVTNPAASMRVTNPSAPIMVVNALWDGVTGYDQALHVHSQIENSFLVTRYGEGHGSQEFPGAKQAMDRYLINLTIPEGPDTLVDQPWGVGETDFERFGWAKTL